MQVKYTWGANEVQYTKQKRRIVLLSLNIQKQYHIFAVVLLIQCDDPPFAMIVNPGFICLFYNTRELCQLQVEATLPTLHCLVAECLLNHEITTQFLCWYPTNGTEQKI